jgi:hypothetical protein
MKKEETLEFSWFGLPAKTVAKEHQCRGEGGLDEIVYAESRLAFCAMLNFE